MTGFEISEFRDTDLPSAVARSIAQLACQSFTASRRTVEERVAGMEEMRGKTDLATRTGRRFVIWNGGQAIAHARVFVREIHADSGSLPVLALASVCSDPERRGQGLGAAVTRQAFDLVGRPTWPSVSLFQTPVPEFYARLGCRPVDNRFVNRLNRQDPEARPWRDEYVMIYPGEFAWPGGPIDLNGPDY